MKQMNNENRELLDAEIETRLNAMDSSDYGSEDDERAVKSLESLYRMRIEEEKVFVDSETKYKECESKDIEHEDQKKAQFIDRCIAIAEFGVTTIGTVGAFMVGYYYEYQQSGMYSSTWFRNLVNTASRLIGKDKKN